MTTTRPSYLEQGLGGGYLRCVGRTQALGARENAGVDGRLLWGKSPVGVGSKDIEEIVARTWSLLDSWRASRCSTVMPSISFSSAVFFGADLGAMIRSERASFLVEPSFSAASEVLLFFD